VTLFKPILDSPHPCVIWWYWQGPQSPRDVTFFIFHNISYVEGSKFVIGFNHNLNWFILHLDNPFFYISLKSLMESQVNRSDDCLSWFIWCLYSETKVKRMRHRNDNRITLTTDYKLVWLSDKSISQQRANTKGVELLHKW